MRISDDTLAKLLERNGVATEEQLALSEKRRLVRHDR